MADPGKFDLKAEVKLTKCDSIPEIRDSIEIRGLDYSSSCSVVVETSKTLSIQCKYEHLRYLLIKPVKVVAVGQPADKPEEWIEVEKLPDRTKLTEALAYSAGTSETKYPLGFAQTLYDGLIALLLSNVGDECSLTFQLAGNDFKKVLVQVVTAGTVGNVAGTDTETGTESGNCTDEPQTQPDESDYDYDQSSSSGGFTQQMID